MKTSRLFLGSLGATLELFVTYGRMIGTIGWCALLLTSIKSL
jgi:hypothetical protein